MSKISRTKRHKIEAIEPNSAVVTVSRKLAPLTRLLLFVRAGGRCEFDGCNKYLLEHHLTLTEGNFAQVAHVVAFKVAGPRGREGPRPQNINDVANLMLLCPQCHKLIDDNPADYSLKTLQEYKERHESRIRHVTGLGPDLKTSILMLKANIGKQTVSIPFNQITEAIAPRYPLSRNGTLIDLTAIAGDDKPFLETAAKTIEQKVGKVYEPGSEASESGHLSVFALAPIPLLIFLGSRLSNKVHVALFQRHRDTENWTWKKGGNTVEYEFKNIRTGAQRENVALLLCLSGTITAKDLPKNIDESFSVYELRPKDLTPDPTLLRSEADLDGFRIAYQQVLGTIVRDHGLIDAVHLFPAVPAPVAILCGRELLPKVHPSLVVYDYDKAKAGFTLHLRPSDTGAPGRRAPSFGSSTTSTLFATSPTTTRFVAIWVGILYATGTGLAINWEAIKKLPDVVTVYVVLLFAFRKWLWRLQMFQGWLVPFPDLQGTWQGELSSTWKDPATGERVQPMPAILVVKQTFNSISCVLYTRESDSYSTAAQISRDDDSGILRLSYNYSNRPKATIRDRSAIHDGAALLRIINIPDRALEGEYWTSRCTAGDLALKFRSRDLVEKLPEEFAA